MLTHTDPRGLTITNSWDGLQRLLRVDFPDGTSVKDTYDRLDLIQVVDRMGFTNSFVYNLIRQLIAQTNANGVATLYDYCTCGALTAVTNAYGTPAQAVSTFTYDNQGNRLSSTGADAYVVNYNYDALGRVTNVADAVSSVTNWFNNQGTVCLVSNALGRLSIIAVDALDRTTNAINANAVTITNTFDNLDRLLTCGYPDGGVERYGYTLNIAGVTSYTNQIGSNVVNYTYDALGRKTVEVHPNVSTNQFSYRIASNKIFDQIRRRTSDPLLPLPMEELENLVTESAKEIPLSAGERLDLEYAMNLLAKAKPACHDLLLSHFIDDLSVKELAAQLNLKIDAVRRRIERCLGLAGGLLGEEYE